MNPGYAKAVVLIGVILLIAIPAAIHHRDGKAGVDKSRRGSLELVVLAIAWLGFLPSIAWLATPLLGFADYPPHMVPFLAGIACLAAGLWLLYRSHADLGESWSITLELHADHRLVTRGVYRSVRHPMYLALLLYAMGQALVLPNWVAGPAYLVAMAILFALRVGPEERMMLESFGKDYEAYVARTSRLVPGVW